MFNTLSIIANSEASIEKFVQMLFEPPKYSIVSIDKLGRGGIQSVKIHQPSLVLLDFQLKDITGLEVAKRIKAHLPECRIFSFLEFSDVSIIDRLAGEKNIDGIAFKGSRYFQENFRKSLDQVLDGEGYIDPVLFDFVRMPTEGNGLRNLTKREFEIFIQINSGKSEIAIAGDLNVEPSHIKNIKSRINKKIRPAEIVNLTTQLAKNAACFDLSLNS